VRYGRSRMDEQRAPTTIWDVISRREARLLFWFLVIALAAIIATLGAEFTAVLAGPALILFVAWLMAYVLEPIVSLLHRHMPIKGRGLSVAITYLVTSIIAIVVLAGAGIAIINASIEFLTNLPAILDRIKTVLEPVVSGLGLQLPNGGSNAVTAAQDFVRSNAGNLADAVVTAIGNAVTVVAGLITAVFISMGLAIGEVSLLGWMRRFLPSSTYRDLTQLEQAIAVSFGGFVRGRLFVGAIYGIMVAITAVVFGVPYAALIAVIAGLIVFIPFIGPLLGWAVLPAFASLLAPDVVIPCLVVSLLGAAAIQVVITPFVMAGAVSMKPVAVFVVVVLGTSIAGVAGAIFAIPTAAAILAITDYLRKRDVLLRAEDGVEVDGETPEIVDAGATSPS
jgi:predicted PurR-regulated permease PerM